MTESKHSKKHKREELAPTVVGFGITILVVFIAGWTIGAEFTRVELLVGQHPSDPGNVANYFSAWGIQIQYMNLVVSVVGILIGLASVVGLLRNLALVRETVEENREANNQARIANNLIAREQANTLRPQIDITSFIDLTLSISKSNAWDIIIVGTCNLVNHGKIDAEEVYVKVDLLFGNLAYSKAHKAYINYRDEGFKREHKWADYPQLVPPNIDVGSSFFETIKGTSIGDLALLVSVQFQNPLDSDNHVISKLWDIEFASELVDWVGMVDKEPPSDNSGVYRLVTLGNEINLGRPHMVGRS